MGFGGGNDLFGYTDDGDGRLLNDGAKSYLWEMQGWLCGERWLGLFEQISMVLRWRVCLG
jgi:hypothetical protein